MAAKINKGTKYKLMMNIYILIILMVFSWAYMYPKYLDYKNVKSDFLDVYNDYIEVRDEGLSFQGFKKAFADSPSLVTKMSWSNVNELKKLYQDTYNSRVVKEIKEDFYNELFNNKTWNRYLVYLESKKKAVEEQGITQKTKESEESIWKILPVYVSNVNMVDEDLKAYSFDDAMFVDYIHSMIKSFGLTLDSWVSFDKLKEVNSSNILEWNKKWDVSSGIYEFSVSLDVIWNKKRVLDFISYIENVWRINFINWEIQTFEPAADIDSYPDIFIWEKNKYENPIIEISNIYFDKYADTYYNKDNVRDESIDFREYVSKTAWKEKFTATIDVKFFVRWIPKHKKEELIKEMEDSLWELNKSYNKLLWMVNNRSFRSKAPDYQEVINEVQNASNYLKAKLKHSAKAKKADKDTAYKFYKDIELTLNRLKQREEEIYQDYSLKK